MSAQPIEKSPTDGLGSDEGPQDGLEAPTPERGGAPEQIEVRHQAAVSLLLGVATSAVAIAYLWRAASTGAAFDWLLCADSRGAERGPVPQPAGRAAAAAGRRRARASASGSVASGAVCPGRRSTASWCPRAAALLRDGRLVVNLHHMHRAIEGIEGRARRHARLNQKMYGAVLAVPLGLTTRITHATEDTSRSASPSWPTAAPTSSRCCPSRSRPGRPPPRPRRRRPRPRRTRSTPSRTSRHVIGDDEQPPVADRRPRWLRRGSEPEEPAETSDVEESAGTEGEPSAPTYDVPGGHRAARARQPWPRSTKVCARWAPRPPRCRPSPRR